MPSPAQTQRKAQVQERNRSKPENPLAGSKAGASVTQIRKIAKVTKQVTTK